LNPLALSPFPSPLSILSTSTLNCSFNVCLLIYWIFYTLLLILYLLSMSYFPPFDLLLLLVYSLFPGLLATCKFVLYILNTVVYISSFFLPIYETLIYGLLGLLNVSLSSLSLESNGSSCKASTILPNCNALRSLDSGWTISFGRATIDWTIGGGGGSATCWPFECY